MVSDLLSSGNYMDIYIVARWAYKIGMPIMKDELFDKYESILKKKYPEQDIFKYSYEDDNEPTELLEKYNISFINSVKRNTNYIATSSDIADTEPISQRPVRDKRIAYEWYRKFNNQSICHSLKVDGISVRISMSKNTKLVQEAYSKVRGNTVTDFTKSVKKKLNKGFLRDIQGSEGNNIIIAAEGIIDNAGLGVYKNGRSAALGILATNVSDYYLNHLHLFAFGGTIIKNNYSNSLITAQEYGFEVVPYVVDTFVDAGYESFCSWIDDITAYLKNKAKELNIQADGIVARLNDCSLYRLQPTNELYSEGSIALKFNEFSAKVYKGVVKDISLEFEGKSSENFTTKLTIEPLITDDNKTISKITGYNLSHIVNKGIKIGSEVEVLYQSGCYPMLLL